MSKNTLRFPIDIKFNMRVSHASYSYALEKMTEEFQIMRWSFM